MYTIAFLILAFLVLIIVSYYLYKHYFKTSNKVIIESVVVNESINLLSSFFKEPIQIKSIVCLSEPNSRNLVLRLMIMPHNGIPKSVILKQSLSLKNEDIAFDRFARDCAGLEFVNTLNTKIKIVPRFYGCNKEYRFILLEDLGEPHISLVDSLTIINNSKAATEALQRFMICLGQLHSHSYQNINEYFKILKNINPSMTTIQDKLTDKLLQLQSVLQGLKISCTTHLLDILSTVLKENTGSNSFTTFGHGDICPDNTFDNQNKKTLLLIDFEHGKVQNALLDATYLRMGMPTCWCAKAFPEELIKSLDSLYRQQLIEKIPTARNDDAYYEAYVNACAYWMIQSVLMIEDVQNKDDIWGISSVRSRILSRLEAFIDVSNQYNKLPELKVLSEDILQKLKIQWPDVKPLDLFPAFLPK